MNCKKFVILFISLFIIGLVIILSFVAIVDPYFHYHKPLKKLNYRIDTQRYQNYGIVQNFDYDAIIIGTSMTENFKTSELDKLFNTNSIKTPMPGASYHELAKLLNESISNNKKLKYVFMSLDETAFFLEKDYDKWGNDLYPTYLYDDNIINDVKYVFNKQVIIKSIHTLFNDHSTTFDEYSYWSDKMSYGKEYIIERYDRPTEKVEENVSAFNDNVNQNIISFIRNNPDIEFYFFYPPYSIFNMDKWNIEGNLELYFNTEKKFTEKILKYSNAHIYSFYDDYEMITNFENYKDPIHYSGEINSKILVDMKNHNHELTKHNYKKYYNEIKKYYNEYDYNALFE